MASRSESQPEASLVCRNCGTVLHGKFCGDCGQPAEGMVREFRSMLGDVLDSVLNIDARVAHTLLPLYFRPGKLTLDYFDGKRARYVTPFRLVFFLAIVAFFSVQLALRTHSVHVVQFQTPTIAGASISSTPVAGGHDTHFANGDVTINDRIVWNRQTKPWRAGWLPDVANEWINDSIENARSNLHRMNSGNLVEEKSAAEHLMGGVFAMAPQVLFVMLPVFALLLKAFYVFKRRLYMEHLIVAMHSHAFILLSLLVLIALDLLRTCVAPHVDGLAALSGLLHDAVWVWVVVYVFLMQKRVYQQGWPMTTLKFFCIGVCYGVLVVVAMAFALAVSLGSA